MSWTHRGKLAVDWPFALWSILIAGSLAAAELPPLHQRIDQAIAAAHDAPLATSADDEEFARRVYLDLIGRIPTRGELQQFRSNNSADKRAELIDALLASDESNTHLAIVFDVM